MDSEGYVVSAEENGLIDTSLRRGILLGHMTFHADIAWDVFDKFTVNVDHKMTAKIHKEGKKMEIRGCVNRLRVAIFEAINAGEDNACEKIGSLVEQAEYELDGILPDHTDFIRESRMLGRLLIEAQTEYRRVCQIVYPAPDDMYDHLLRAVNNEVGRVLPEPQYGIAYREQTKWAELFRVIENAMEAARQFKDFPRARKEFLRVFAEFQRSSRLEVLHVAIMNSVGQLTEPAPSTHASSPSPSSRVS